MSKIIRRVTIGAGEGIARLSFAPFRGRSARASRRNLRLPNPLLGFSSAPAVPIKKTSRRRSFLLERVKGIEPSS